MKLKFDEYADNFALNLEAENQAEAAYLTRLGLLARAEQPAPYVCVYKEGGFFANLRYDKSKSADNVIVNRRKRR